MKQKHISTLLIYQLLLATIAYSNKPVDPQLKTSVQQWLCEQPVRFLENKGQITDASGKPLPFVFFKTETPGLNMFVTDKGLTYMFIKTHEKEKNDHKYAGNKFSQRTEQPEQEEIKTEWTRIDMSLKGATIKKENIFNEGMSTGFSQYFLAHCPDGITDVRSYEKITIEEIYPGIDWVLYNSDNKGFKYDFIVHPGADPKQIELVYSSLLPLKLNSNGNIEIKTNLGTLTENAPVSYLRKKNSPHGESQDEVILTQFIKKLNFRNDQGGYDTFIQFHFLNDLNGSEEADLIIDPQLTWSTLYGSNGLDGLMSIDCDIFGNIFITGYLNPPASNIPVLNPLGGAYFQGTYGGGQGDVVILKFSNTGVLLWATYYGGTVSEGGNFICTDLTGNVFVTGATNSTNFPVFNALGGTYFQATNAGGFYPGDAFVLKFSNSGVRLWATYYGGTGAEDGNSICTDLAGNIFITGWTSSVNFPVLNPLGGTYFQAAKAGGDDAFILKFSNTGIQLWATYYGGTGNDEGVSICTDALNNIFVTGSTYSTNFPIMNPFGGTYFQPANGGGAFTKDAFILKFSNAGIQIWATYYGGSGNEGGAWRLGFSICTDLLGNIFVIGFTSSSAATFPLLNLAGAYFDNTLGGGSDIFLLKFSNAGVLLWATYYGGSAGENTSAFLTSDNIVVDPCNNIYVSFQTSSTDVTVKNSCNLDYFDNSYNGGSYGGDLFIVKFNALGALQWATYFGGNDSDVRGALAIDSSGNLYSSGESWGIINHPFLNPGGGAFYDNTANGSDDGYIAKFIPSVVYAQNQTNNTSCSPCNGSATINITCGEPSYNYTWSNGSSTLNTTSNSNTITGLCTGTYTVTATGSCNQTQTAIFAITGTTCVSCTLTGQITKGTASCASCGCKEWVMVNAIGGTSPYSYSWPDGYSNRYKNQLCPGTYSINITDKNGCSMNISLTAP
ncbi:MAG: SBBP repeat-containing protein [Bacteroidetes bacterium]|nr:SBBP repeat-containing protein [Bacteroidota bacterium]